MLMGNLAIKNEVIVAGIKIPNINGGFGENKKSMLVKHIAEIHNKELKHVNETINDNIGRFKDFVDIIDVKSNSEFVVALTDHNIFSKMQVAKANNIYLLSERGYAKLIKLFNDDKSWELYDQLLDEYFELRDGNIIPMNNQPSTELQILQGAINQLVQQEKKLLEMNDKVTKLETEFNKETVEEGYSSNDFVARQLNLFSTSNRPHFNFIDAIAKHLHIYNTTIGYKDKYVNVRRETVKGGQVGIAIYYSEEAVELMKEFLDNEFKPNKEIYSRTDKKGKFKKASFELDKNYNFNEKTYLIYNK